MRLLLLVVAAAVEGNVSDPGLDCPLAGRDSMGEEEEVAVGGGRLETAVLRRELIYRPGKGKMRRPVTYCGTMLTAMSR